MCTFKDGTKADIFEWLESVVIPNLYNTEHYNEQQVSSNDSRFLTDFYSFRLGPPRLRLLRVDDGIYCHDFVLYPSLH